jgi:hypothetical protein
MLLRGSFYAYGIAFQAGSGAGNSQLTVCDQSGNRQVFESCKLAIVSTGTAGGIRLGQAGIPGIASAELIGCTIEFGGVAQNLFVCGRAEIRGGGASSGGAAPNNFSSPSHSAGETFHLLVDGFDFSNWGSSLNLVLGGAVIQPGQAVFRNCKLPASWTGLLVSTPFTAAGFRAEMWNCSASDTNYAMRVQDAAGSIRDETTIYRTSGASDGDTTISWKMESSANASYPAVPLRSPEIFVPNTAVGSSQTLTVEIAQDGTTTALDNDEIWLEVEYLGTTNFPLALFADDAAADVIATPAAQTDSTESWTGLSGTEKRQKLSLSVTPQEKGVFIARVCLAKASTTVYVCPKVDVT